VTFSLTTFLWRESAPAALLRMEGALAEGAILDDLRARDDGFGGSVFTFRIPLPDSLRSLRYLLVHARGTTVLRPDSLRGTVRVRRPDSTSRIGPADSYGEVHASAPIGRGPVGGGFVLISSIPLRATTAPSHYTADELLGPPGADRPFRGTSFWQIRAQFSLTVGSESYAFVQWAPDDQVREAGCEYRFSLFRLGRTPTLVATNDYGCDV
jgi:hypothetical protein